MKDFSRERACGAFWGESEDNLPKTVGEGDPGVQSGPEMENCEEGY